MKTISRLLLGAVAGGLALTLTGCYTPIDGAQVVSKTTTSTQYGTTYTIDVTYKDEDMSVSVTLEEYDSCREYDKLLRDKSGTVTCLG